jgi:FkbM family methyltransferase
MFSDCTSLLNYIRLRTSGNTSGKLRRAPLTLRLRCLGDQLVYCRPATTDLNVVNDTFFCGHHLPPRDLHIRTILDLGSNIGLTIAHYAHLYPEARILGVELDSDNAQVGQKNIAPFGQRCELVVGAVWIGDGQVTYGGQAEWGFHVTGEAPRGSNGVPAFGVGSLIRRMGVPRVDFVKMDIEGAEKNVLASARSWIDQVTCLKIEVHSPYTVADCLRDLQLVGMQGQVMENHHGCVLARHRAQ